MQRWAPKRNMISPIGNFPRLVLMLPIIMMGMYQPAMATPTQFAQFTNNGANDATNGFRWVNDGNTSATFDTASTGAAVTFNFTNLPGLAPELQGVQSAHLFFSTGTNLSGQSFFGQLNQPLSSSILIQILRDSPASVGSGTRENLLTISVVPNSTLSVVSGQNGSASLTASAPGQTITFSSDFYDFSNVTANGLGLTFSGIVPGLSFNTSGGHSILNSFTAAAIGSFTADLNPVPEPTSLALMGIGGVLICGASLRARRRNA